MDFNSLKDTVSNLTLYDIKAGVRKVQNAVMNYTEMEAKVREATNNEPWGASSTLMQEIANGTFNYQTLNEIMPMIYRRFTEKSAEEWRQIYKALQLLEFLIKHGSERVIDDARSHLTLLKMLRQFHYIDPNGKDQGVNVRNRAKELADLLSDVDKIRAERKKARNNRTKYTGVEGGMGLGTFGTGGFSGSGSGGSGRFGGFGSESSGYHGSTSFGGYSGGVYGDGGGFGGETSDFRDNGNRPDKFEEYDEYDEGERRPSAAAESSSRAGIKRTTGTSSAAAGKKAEPAKQKAPEVDLFSFDDPAPGQSASASLSPPSNGSGLAALAPVSGNDEDEFDDFQSATPTTQAAHARGPSLAGLSNPLAMPPMVTSNASTAQFAAPQPLSGPKQANLSDMVGFSSISPPPGSGAAGSNYSAFSAPIAPLSATSTGAAAPKPAGYQPTGPNYFQSVQVMQPQATPTAGSGAGMAGLKPAGSSAAKPASSGGDAFGALWSQASSGIKKAPTPTAGPTVGQLVKEKSSAGIWGAPAAAKPMQPSQPPSGSGGGAFGDLLG